MTESNVELARSGYEAIMRGDLDAVRDLLDPDVKWHGGDPADGCQNRKQTLEWMRRNWTRRKVLCTYCNIYEVNCMSHWII